MRKFTKKTAALSCAVIMCISYICGGIPSAGHVLYAAPENTEMTDTVKVIVTLKDGDTAKNSSVLQEQKKVQDIIHSLYPDFHADYSYSLLINGFSCEIPESLVSSVRNIPQVKSVTESFRSRIPDMTDASGCGSVSVFEDETGCFGEGKVIAVIDNELDISHDMFSAIDSKNNKLSHQNIEKIISEGSGMNGKISDADQVYINSKLPFVFDYADGVVNDPSLFHGTHVAAIAAGNKVSCNGNTVSGVARDAQIVFMGISDSKGFLNDDAIIAALEDAVRLKADVINMSFSDKYEAFRYNDPVREAMDAARQAGIIICQAAGNNGSYISSPSFPNTGTINESCSFPGVFSVASAQPEGSSREKTSFLHFNGAKIMLRDITVEEYEDEGCVTPDFAGLLEKDQYQLAAPDPKNIDRADIEGKIVVFKTEDDITLNRVKNITKKLKEKGAAGMLFSVPELTGISLKYSYFPYVPCAVISSESADYILKNISAGTVTISDRNEDSEGIMSAFSSWGVSSSLKLKPEISGFGSEILSADKNNGFCVMSGTSMSSPYIAGCAAAAEEFAEKKGYLPKGEERSVFIKNLLMNSAVPASFKDIFISPRKQGAGIADMKNLSETGVIMTGESGEAKIELYDRLTDNLSFDINLSNFCGQDVVFKKAELVLFTDTAEYFPDYSSYITDGSVLLKHKADLSSLLSIKAGEERKETVNVRLDSSQTSKNLMLYNNGFFIDGYILLSGADNCADISIPLLGFYGDWNSKQLLTYDRYEGPAESLSAVVKNAADLYRKDGDISGYISSLPVSDEHMYINHRIPGIRSSLTGKFEFTEYCFRTGELINNENGNRILEAEFPNNNLTFADSLIDPELEDGSYTLKIKAFTDFFRSREDPQTAEYRFVTDSVSPETDFSVSVKNEKKFLNIRSSDKNLDGFIITGYKKDPDSPDPGKLLGTAGRRFMLSASDFGNQDLPDILKMLDPSGSTGTSREYNCIDAVSASGNSINISYDISDLEYYTAVVADKALNFSLFTSEDEKNTPFIPGGSDELYGDTDCSGTVNIADIVFLKHCILYPSEVNNIKAADLNGDSALDAADLILLLKLFLNN